VIAVSLYPSCAKRSTGMALPFGLRASVPPR